MTVSLEKPDEELFNLSYKDKSQVLKELFGHNRAAADFPSDKIVDQVLELRKSKSLLEAREKLLMEILKGRFATEIEKMQETLEPFVLQGKDSLGLNAIWVSQQRLDIAAIKEEMGEDWVEEHGKTVEFVQFKEAK